MNLLRQQMLGLFAVLLFVHHARSQTPIASSPAVLAQNAIQASVLIPQSSWDKRSQGAREPAEELLSLIQPYTFPNDSLSVDTYPEVFNGIMLMDPLPMALEKLGVANRIIPSKSPIAFPGVPFFFRVFSRPYTENGVFYNLTYVITDAKDRVVGIQLVSETPVFSHKPTDDGRRYYNFINNRRKAVKTLVVIAHVTNPYNRSLPDTVQSLGEKRQKEEQLQAQMQGVDSSKMSEQQASWQKSRLEKSRRQLAEISNRTLVVRTQLFDLKDYKPLEQTAWYAPQRVFDFISHCLFLQLQDQQ